MATCTCNRCPPEPGYTSSEFGHLIVGQLSMAGLTYLGVVPGWAYALGTAIAAWAYTRYRTKIKMHGVARGAEDARDRD